MYEKKNIKKVDKAEIKKLARSEFESMLNSSDIKTKIEKMVKNQLGKDKATQKEVANITQKVLVQFYKTLWNRRTFWVNKLDNI